MELKKRWFLLATGTAVYALGIDLGCHAGFGGTTLSTLWNGICLHIPVTFGEASLIVAAAMLIISFILDKKQIRWGTLFYQIFYSLCLDFFLPLLRYSDSAVANFLLMLLGILLYAIGAGICSYADVGKGPYEALTFAISGHFSVSVKASRMLLDAIAVVTGWLLGAEVGLCTIVALLISGKILQKTVEILRKKNFFGIAG